MSWGPCHVPKSCTVTVDVKQHFKCFNGMAEILKCFIKIFADDTQVYTAMQSDEHKRLL